MERECFEIDAIPLSVLRAIESERDIGEILLTLKTDLNISFSPCERYVVATDDTIYVAEGRTSIKKTGKIMYTKALAESVFECARVEEYKLSDLSDFCVEELISSCRLTAKTEDGTTVPIAAFTNFYKLSAALFCKYIVRVKDGTYVCPKKDDLEVVLRCPVCGTRYPEKGVRHCPKCSSGTRLFLRMAKFFTRYTKYLLTMVVSFALLTAAGVLSPYLSSGFFYDEVLDTSGKFYGKIITVLLIILAVRVVTQLASMANNYITSIISAKVVYDLKRRIFSAIERLSVGFFSNRQTGGLMTQVTSDANTIYSFFCDILPNFFVNAFQVAALAVIMFAINPLLAAISLLPLPFFFITVKYVYNGHRKYRIRQFAASKKLSSFVSDELTGIRVVKVFSKETEENERFSYYNSRLAFAEKTSSNFNNRTSPLSALILYSGNILCLAFGGLMCIKGTLSYGILLTFVAYTNMIYAPIQFFVSMSESLSTCSAALARLFEIDDAKSDVPESESAYSLTEVKGEVEFRDVSFSYDRNRKILENINFKVEAGKTLGIVGRTGAGKSTLVNLIMRMYDADSGEVLIDGHNVKDVTLRSIYDNIAIVSQETYLFIGTILDNIRYARPDATYDEVIAASKAAGAHDFIMRFKDAYMTTVGSGYKDLSGGEKQRISIARALLKNPKILILDEATAAMDTRTERTIQRALTELTEGRTTVMIAHRLSTLRDADYLIVIDNGKVAEEGTHTELIEKDGIYNRLYTLQNEALKSAGVLE